jgi:hypothetical protein
MALATWWRGDSVPTLSLLQLFGLIVVLGLIGAIYESAAEAADMRAYPPPDQIGRCRRLSSAYQLHGDWQSHSGDRCRMGRLVRVLEQLGAARSRKDHAGLHV